MSQKDHRFPSGVPALYDQPATHILCEVVRNPEHVFDAVKKTRMQTRSRAIEQMLDEDQREIWEMCQHMYETEVFPKTKVIHGVKGYFEQKIVNPLSPQKVAKEIMTIVRTHRRHRDANCKVCNMIVLASTIKEVRKYLPHLETHAQSEGIRVVTDPSEQEEGCLAIESVRRFAGMERAVVIIVDLNVASAKIHSWPRLYIQAISRSMMNVYLIEQAKLEFLPSQVGYSVFKNQKQNF